MSHFDVDLDCGPFFTFGFLEAWDLHRLRSVGLDQQREVTKLLMYFYLKKMDVRDARSRGANLKKIKILAGGGDKLIGEIVLYWLADTDFDVCGAAVTILGRMAVTGDVLEAIFKVFQSSELLELSSLAPVNDVNGDTPRPIEHLSHGVSYYMRFVESWFVRVAALRALAMIAQRGDHRAIKLLLSVCNDPMAPVREAALKAMAVLSLPGDESIINKIIDMFTDGCAFVRESASSVLPDVVESVDVHVMEPIICLALEDTIPSVRTAAEGSVAKLAITGTKIALSCIAQRMEHTSWIVREAAVRLIGRISRPGCAQAIKLVVARFKDDYWEVRHAAVEEFVELSIVTNCQNRSAPSTLDWP